MVSIIYSFSSLDFSSCYSSVETCLSCSSSIESVSLRYLVKVKRITKKIEGECLTAQIARSSQ